MRLRQATQVNSRAVKNGATLYRDARLILEQGIAFSPAERLIKARTALDALEAAKTKQVEGAWRAAQSTGQAKRAEVRILALYAAELAKCQRELTDAEKEVQRRMQELTKK